MFAFASVTSMVDTLGTLDSEQVQKNMRDAGWDGAGRNLEPMSGRNLKPKSGRNPTSKCGQGQGQKHTQFKKKEDEDTR